jgi:hypothetical protein
MSSRHPAIRHLLQNRRQADADRASDIGARIQVQIVHLNRILDLTERAFSISHSGTSA